MITYTFQSAQSRDVCVLLTVLVQICGRKVITSFTCAQIDPSPVHHCFLTTALPPHRLTMAMAALPNQSGRIMLETLDIE